MISENVVTEPTRSRDGFLNRKRERTGMSFGAQAEKLWQLWSGFWFESNSPAKMRLFRFAIASLMFCVYACRTPDLKLFFSQSGIMPLENVPDILPMGFRPSLLFYFTSDFALWVLHAILLTSLALLALGVYPRIMAVVAQVVNVSFLHRNMSPTYGVDMVSSFFIYYLWFADYRDEAPRDSWRAMMGSVAYRLAQLQVCIIYAYSGLDKVKGVQWWHGEALWGVLSNVQLARFDFSAVSHLPLVIIALTYATLAWEIYFPVLIWVKPLRNFMLIFGVGLHLGIALSVNLVFFGLLMIFSYIVFIEESLASSLLESRVLRGVLGTR